MNPLNPEIRTILFDCNGTLFSRQNHGSRDLTVIEKMAQLLDSPLTPNELASLIHSREEQYKTWSLRTLVELPIEERWSQYLLPEYPKEFVCRLAGQLQQLWADSKGKKVISEETLQTLQELTARGYILGTVSNSSHRLLLETGIENLFKVTFHAVEYGRRKPHPSIFMDAVRACNVAPVNCAYVGNRPSRDIVGSREAGLGKIILIEDGRATVKAEPCPMHADAVIHEFKELLDLFPVIQSKPMGQNRRETLPEIYDAALSTMWWNKETDTADEFCLKGKEIGFARFELNHQIPPSDLAAFDLERFHIGTLHDPCPAVIPAKQMEREDQQVTSLDEALRKSGVDAVKRTIDQAYKLCARSVVIHPGRITGDHSMDNRLRDLYKQGKKGTPEYESLRQELITDRENRNRPHLDALLKSMHEIKDFARDTGLMLGLENRFHYYELPIFDEMKILMEEFKQPWIGWQMDVGHLQVMSELGLMSFSEWLDAFDSRIVGTHLHDVRGIMDHRAPGTGEVNFDLIAAHLPTWALRTVEVDKSQTFEEMKSGLRFLETKKCVNRL